MKKIFYILASAIVALGAVACENDVMDNIATENEGLSFVATIDNSKTDLEGLKTVWSENDVITINGFEFAHQGEGKFTCTDSEVSTLKGQGNLIAWYNEDGIDSEAGTAGAQLKAEGAFDAEGNASVFSFEVQNAFLKFTTTETVTLNGTGLFVVNKEVSNEVTIEGTGAVQYVAINPANTTLSYSVNGVKCKEVTLPFEAKNIYNLGTLYGPGYTVYVYNDSKWSDVYIYSWDNNGELTGTWPGTKMTKTDVNGVEYYKYEFDGSLNGKAINMIFNNNNGSQTADLPATLNSDLYYLSTGGVIEDPANPIPAQTYKVYAYKHNITWNPFNFYCWGSVTYSKAWPGTALTETTKINGYTYYVYEMPATATGQNIQMIFNNGSAQTGDSAKMMLDKDLYVRVTAASVTLLDDPNNPLPEEVIPDYKVYVKNTAKWSNVYVYAWNGVSAGNWPGTKMTTEEINGTTYYVHEFAGYGAKTGISLIFNNGSGSQTNDITKVSLTKDLFYEVKGTGTNYTTIPDPRN